MVVTHVRSCVTHRPAPVQANARIMVWSADLAFSRGEVGSAASAAISIGLLGSGSKQDKTSRVLRERGKAVSRTKPPRKSSCHKLHRAVSGPTLVSIMQ